MPNIGWEIGEALPEGNIEPIGALSSIARLLPETRLNTRDWICRIETTSAKTSFAAVNRHHDAIEEIAGSLNLAAKGSATFKLLESRCKSPYFGLGVIGGGTPTRTRRSSGNIVMDQAGVDAFKKCYAGVTGILGNERLRFLRLPFNRLRAASSRQENEDQLVDYVIALERLLASDSPALETTYRFQLRGAALLPASFGTESQRMAMMRDLYSLRSKVVHGTAQLLELQEMVPRAEEILRYIFNWYLDHTTTFPDGKTVITALDQAMVRGGTQFALDSLPAQNDRG